VRDKGVSKADLVSLPKPAFTPSPSPDSPRSPLPPSFPPTPLVPPYKRGDDRGCFAFFAGGMTEDASLFLQGG